MAKDYAAISKKIVENIGGVENIASVTHCMTRLRFVVKDEGKINDAAVKATDGVMGVVNQGGQYQIIIGNHVEEAYNEELGESVADAVMMVVGLSMAVRAVTIDVRDVTQAAPFAATVAATEINTPRHSAPSFPVPRRIRRTACCAISAPPLPFFSYI